MKIFVIASRAGAESRKIRWATKGKGKRGGIRVIFYLIKPDCIYLLFAYPKNEQENLTKKQLDILRQIVNEELT